MKLKLKSTQKVFTGKITAHDIRKMLDLPDNAVITLDVPTGGDFSGQRLVLGDDIPQLDVRVEEQS